MTPVIPWDEQQRMKVLVERVANETCAPRPVLVSN